MAMAQPEQSQKQIDEMRDALLGNKFTKQVGLLDDVAQIKEALHTLKDKDVADLKARMNSMDIRLTHRIEKVETGMTEMQVGIANIQISVDNRNSKRDEADEKIVLDQRTIIFYGIALLAVGVVVGAIVVALFGGGNEVDPSISTAIPELLSYLSVHGRNHLWHVAKVSAQPGTFAAYAALAHLRSDSLPNGFRLNQ